MLGRRTLIRIAAKVAESGLLVFCACILWPGEVSGQDVRVRISTDTYTTSLPGVKVRIGSYSVTTDARGIGTLMVPPGTYQATVESAPCAASQVVVTGGIVKSGPETAPMLTIPRVGSASVSFLFGCEKSGQKATVRVKIAATSSCSGATNEAFRPEEGIKVQIGQNEYTSNKNGVIEVDLPPGRYPVFGIWKDYSFGWVRTNNGIELKPTENSFPEVDLKGKEAALEVRMFTCGVDGRERPRAVITELGVTGIGTPATILVKRSQVTGNGFVGMQLRDGDTVKVSGTAKIRWLDPEGTVSFSDPRAQTEFTIGPSSDTPKGVAEKHTPGVIDFFMGVGDFLFVAPFRKDPDADEVVRDEHGNFKGVIIKTRNARIWIKGTQLTVGYNEANQTTTVKMIEGLINVEPLYANRPRFDLGPGQSAEISPSGDNRSDAVQDPPWVRPTKPVFGLNEQISIEYLSMWSGWDLVVVVDPAKIAPADFGQVTPNHRRQLDENEPAFKERRGTFTFNSLPEGEYDARYVAWHYEGSAGANKVIRSVRFRVGNAPPTSTPGPGPATPPAGSGGTSPATPGTPPPAAPRWNLTGLWRNPGGEGIYRIRQIDAKVVWGLDATSIGSIANMFQGQMSGDNVDGVWEDLPGSPTIGGGRMLLKVESECRFVRVSSVNRYGADVWVKKDSPCDRQTGGTSGTPATSRWDLTGLWRNPGAEAVYRVRQIQTKVVWGLDATPLGSFANMFQGQISGDNIDGVWEDLPGSPTIGGGRMLLKVESECRFVRVSSVNRYGADVWVKKGSRCDVAGLTQRTGTTSSPPPAKPRVEEIPGIVVVDDRSGVFKEPAQASTPGTKSAGKPKVEEIPGEEAPTPKPKPELVVEEIPIDEPVAKAPAGSAQPKPDKTPKPKSDGPSIWERLGTAINQAVTQQPPTTGGGAQQPDGSCRGGSYWIGAPASPRSTGFQIPWSMPFGSSGHHWRVYRAGTNQHVTNNDQPENANACGLSWHFYLAAGQYDVYLFPGTFANTWNTNTRPVAGPVRVVVTQ